MPKIITSSELKKDNKKEVDEMLSSFTKSVSGEQEEPEEEIVNEEEQHEAEEQEERQSAESESTESEEEEEQTVAKQEESEDEEPRTDEVNDELRRRIAELETGQAFKGDEQEPEQPQQQQVQQTEEKPSESVMQFVTEEEFEEMQTNPAKVNEIMTRVYQRARQDTMRDIPDLVQQTSARQMSLQDAVRKFYDNNPELQNYAQYVGFVANQVKSEKPELAIQDVLEETEKRVRKSLSISKQAKEKEEDRRKKQGGKDDAPAFAKRGSGNHKGGKQDSRSDFAKEVDAMLQTVNR